MIATVLEFLPKAALAGAAALWLGVILMFLSPATRRLLDGTTLRTIALPPAKQAARNIEQMNSDLEQIGKTRIGRLGRILATLGISLLLLTGLLWVTLRIAQGPAA
jgi:hypothetical protein